MARSETVGAQLGDARLSQRLEQIVESLARKPGESLPDAMGSEAALEATYRFLGNEKVSPEAILAPHAEQTRARCVAAGRALVIFDTSELRYSGERDELGYLTNEKSRGLYAHVGLAVNPVTSEPLGVLRCETWVRRGPRSCQVVWN